MLGVASRQKAGGGAGEVRCQEPLACASAFRARFFSLGSGLMGTASGTRPWIPILTSPFISFEQIL